MTGAHPPLRVLIVEDEPLLAVDLEMTIEDCGHLIAGGAQCFDSALALDDNTNPHVAFVDVQLAHNTSGVDVSGMIQRRWPRAVIVFLTANRERVPADLGGAYGIIIKPFTSKSIATTLEYLNEGIFDLPPHLSKPACLTTVA